MAGIFDSIHTTRVAYEIAGRDAQTGTEKYNYIAENATEIFTGNKIFLEPEKETNTGLEGVKVTIYNKSQKRCIGSVTFGRCILYALDDHYEMEKDRIAIIRKIK